MKLINRRFGFAMLKYHTDNDFSKYAQGILDWRKPDKSVTSK